MDSRLLQKDSFNVSDDEEEELYSIRTRQRSAAKQIKRKDISTRQIRNEIEPHVENVLLGENGLGLTAEEFSALPHSERKQLMEAVLLSKKEYDKQKNKMESEQLDGHTKTSGNKATVNSMPVRLDCCTSLPVVIIDPAIAQNCSSVPSLNKFRLKRLSAVAAEGKMHAETVECKITKDCVAEANAAELISCAEYGYSGAEKLKLSAGKPEVGETYSSKKNEDLNLRLKTHPQDCLVVQKSNSADSLTHGQIIQPRTRSGEIVSWEKETSDGCLWLTNDDKRQMSTVVVPAPVRQAETAEKTDLQCPGLPIPCQLFSASLCSHDKMMTLVLNELVNGKLTSKIIQFSPCFSVRHVDCIILLATDMRPLFKHKGLNLKTRAKLIYDYYTDCELRHYKSYCEINSRTQWGKPVAIAVDKGRVSTRNRRLRQVVAETEEMNDGSPHKNENQALDSPAHSICDIESEDVKQFPSSTVTRRLLDVSVVLDYQCSREDIETRLRMSRQTKIGGGLVEEEGAKISRRKIPVSDDENDPDFTPEKKKRRIHVDNRLSRKSDKLKKLSLDVVKGKEKDLKRSKGQLAECSKTSEMNKESSDEYDEEIQESRNLPKSWQSVGKCQILAMSRTNGNNNSNTRSSSSSEDFYETKSTAVSEVEEHISISDISKNVSPVNDRVLNESDRQTAELEDVSSSSPVSFGRNSALRDDTKPQIFPVFHKLVRPSLREDEGFTDTTRNIPSTSKNANSTKNEDIEECLSGYSSEGNDSSLDKSTKKRKKSRDQHPAFAKTYQKKKVKTAADQQTIISFATPSFKIPKVTRMCPMCQKDFPVSSLEEHVQICIELDDEKKTIK